MAYIRSYASIVEDGSSLRAGLTILEACFDRDREFVHNVRMSMSVLSTREWAGVRHNRHESNALDID